MKFFGISVNQNEMKVSSVLTDNRKLRDWLIDSAQSLCNKFGNGTKVSTWTVDVEERFCGFTHYATGVLGEEALEARMLLDEKSQAILTESALQDSGFGIDWYIVPASKVISA